jgi:hypothetical protein
MNKNVIEKMYACSDKVELSEVSVELALIDDVKAAYKTAIDARKKSFDEMQLLGKKVQETLKTMQGLVKSNEDALPAFEKFETAAKSLGIDVPKDIVDQKKNIQDGLKGTLATYIKNLNAIKLF